MAKKFHLTPDGPKPCNAKFRPCPYAHYTNKNDAENAFKKQQNMERYQSIENALKLKIKQPKSTVFANMNERGDYGRTLATEIMYADGENLETPDLVEGQVYGDFAHEDSPIRVEFAAVKNYKIQGKPPRIMPHWTLTLTKYSGMGSEVIANETVSLSTAREGQEFKLKAHSYMQNAASHVNQADPEWQNQKVSEYYDSFVNNVKAIESSERGGYGAHLVGFGYFDKSTPEKLQGRIDFSETAFTGKEVGDMLKSSEYDGKIPEVDLLIQDSDAKNSESWWAVQRNNQGWRLYLHKSDGTILASEPMKSPEFFNKGIGQISSFTSAEMGFNEGKRDHHTVSASIMAKNIDNALADHMKKIKQMQHEKEQQQELKNHQKLYKNNGKQNSFDKMLGLLT